MVINETLNQSFEIAQGVVSYSPPPTAPLTTNLVLMAVFLFLIILIYIRIQQTKKNK